MRRLVGAWIVLLAAASCLARPLELSDFLALQEVSNPRISPDGKFIVYVRRHVDRENDKWAAELWIINSDGTDNRYLFSDGTSVEWSPQSDRIAYVRFKKNESVIVVQDPKPGSAPSEIATSAYRIRNLRWAPDGNFIAFTATVPMKEHWPITLPGQPEESNWTPAPHIFDRLHYRIDGEGFKTGFDHIFIVRSSGGSPRQLTTGEWDVGARAAGLNTLSRLEWGNDGKHIFFDGLVGDESLGMASNVYRVSVDSGETRQLTADSGFWSSPRVSPNGKQFAYVGYSGTTPDQTTYPGYQIRIMDVDGGNQRVVHKEWQGRIYTQVAAVADFLSWSNDGRGLYITTYANGARNVGFVGLDGNVRPITNDKANPNGFDISSASVRGLAAGIVSTAHMPGNVATADLNSGEVRQLTDVNSEMLKGIQLGEVEEIWYESDPGVQVQGWIVKPPDFDESKKYPMVLSIHGGPHAMYGPSFSFFFQEFAAKGYVVLYTNPRGSLGYGINFANAINDSITGAEGFNDLMAGVDEVLARGYVDEDRLNVTGCSGGGLMTNWVVTQTNRFKAAAALCSISNWTSFAGTADIVIGIHHFFDQRFWEDPTSWVEHSPISHVANVTTPTLLMTGELDQRTPISQAEEFYSALKIRRIPTKLIFMKKEYHGTGRIPSNALRTQLYLQKWFEEHGGGPVNK